MDDATNTRDKTGRFVPGISGNPGGRPALGPELRDVLEAAVPRVARRLVELVDAKDPRVSLAACETILNRLFGKPSVAIDANIKNVNVNEAHLEALREINERRQQRVLELSLTGKTNCN